MATTFHNALQQLYVAYFNRPADPAGLAFYETALESGGTTLEAISASFAASAEYKAEYSQLTNTGVVTQVYQNLFGKTPDAPGLAFWVNALNTGATTIGKMVTDIAAGAQNADKIAFESKVVVATAFTNALNTQAEITAYNTEEAQAEAKDLLSTIKTAAQATAAIVPATLDASVAAAVKAGTPFTLTAGLAALDAANEAVADFFDEFDTDVNGDGDIDGDDIEANVTEAEDDLAALVADPLFGTTTNAGVKAALLEEQISILDEALEDAEGVLADAQEALDDVDGLGDALASATSAADAADEAADAEIEAEAAFASAETSFEVRNATAVISGDLATGDYEIEDADGNVIVSMEDGELVIADDVDTDDFRGLTALVTTGNAYLSAQADTVAADEAALFAQLQVELLDQEAGSLTGAFTFSETTPEDADAPTFEEILDELSALTAAAVTARAATGADVDGSPADLAADAAELAVTDFRGEIAAFNAANDTALVQDVTDANDAVEAAQADIEELAEAIVAVEDAEALADQLTALEDAVTAAQADFTANDFLAPKNLGVSAFGTSGSDIFVVNGVNSTITSFGRNGDDVLFIGEGFKLNTTGDLTKGDNSALEVFFVQSGNNTIVTIETKAFGSNSADAEIKITLTGVDADDLTFADGIISI